MIKALEQEREGLREEVREVKREMGEVKRGKEGKGLEGRVRRMGC